jgi:4'-phosphopantetheinyl transferase
MIDRAKVVIPERDTVDVWLVGLDGPASDGDWDVPLTEDEMARAARFRFPRDASRFRAARRALRRLLGRYLTVDPASIALQYEAHGKPALAGPFADCGLHFNVSHSHDAAAIAVSREAVGVDIEIDRPVGDALLVARTAFAADEYAELITQPEAERMRGFLRIWTRKEAYVKACGEGLSTPLDSFCVPVVAAPRGGVAVRHSTGGSAGWTLYDVDDGNRRIIGALAMRADSARLVIRRYGGVDVRSPESLEEDRCSGPCASRRFTMPPSRVPTPGRTWE